MRVAILGTGRMGSAIARRLEDTGVELVLWNRTRSRAEDLGAGTVAATPAEAVAMVDTVITSLTGPDALRATLGGPTGALAGARGQTFVEMSTAGPDVLQDLAPLVAESGSRFVDAPVIGAPPAVLKGAELVLASGERADVERVRPILERLGEVRYVGPFGSGARLKLVANSMLGAIVILAAELETAGTCAGLDPDVTFDVLTRLVPALAMRRAGYLEDRHQPTLFALRDLRKDSRPRPRRLSPCRRARPAHGAHPRMGRRGCGGRPGARHLGRDPSLRAKPRRHGATRAHRPGELGAAHERNEPSSLHRTCVHRRGLRGFTAVGCPGHHVGHAVTSGGRGAAPSRGGRRSPGVRAKLIGEQGATRTYQLVLAPGTEAVAAISEFVTQNHIQAAHFHGLGACTDAVLAYYDPTTHEYQKTPTSSRWRSCLDHRRRGADPGDGAGIHAHMGVGFADGTMHGGHLSRRTYRRRSRSS